MGDPRGDQSRSSPDPAWLDRLLALLVSLGLGWLWLRDSFPAPDWLDSPELITAAVRLGPFHPPGAPLAVMSGHLFGLWPFAPPGQSLLFFSAVWASGACYVLIGLVRDLVTYMGPPQKTLARTLAPLLGGALALSPGLYSQAVRTEVYTLAALFFLAGLRCLISAWTGAGKGDDPRRKMELALVFCGLGICVHPLLALGLTPPFMLLSLSPKIRPSFWRLANLVRCAGLFLLSLAPLALLPLMVQQALDLRWGDPSSFLSWLQFISGSTFGGTFSSPGNQGDSGLRLLALLVRDCGWPIFVMSVLGLVLTLRTKPVWACSTLLTVAFASATVLLQRSFRMDNPDVSGYLLPASLALGLLAVSGLLMTGRVLAGRFPKLSRYGLVVAAALLLLGNLWQVHRPWGEGCTTGRAMVAHSLERLPPNTLVLMEDFNLLFMSDYLQQVEGVRPDLDLVYRRDLDNRPMAEARRRLHLARGLPPSSSLDQQQLLALAAQGPLALDWGPLMLDSAAPPGAVPCGLFWVYARERPEACKPDEQILFFHKHRPRCREERDRDERTADVIAWHALWQSQAARREGRTQLARKLVRQAWCARPRDKSIAQAARAMSLKLTGTCPDQRRPAPKIAGAHPPLAKSALLALGLLLWLVGLLSKGPMGGLLWKKMSLALLGILIQGAALAL